MRWLWLDWVRIMAINMVILYHTIEAILNYRRKGALSHELNAMRTYMQSIGLPLFFFISGMVKGLKSTQYTIKRSRILYLFIPLIISSILFLIPVHFLHEHIKHSKNGISFKLNTQCSTTQSHTFFEFLFLYFWKDCFVHVGFGWLWFLPMLTLLEILSLPFVKLMNMTLPLQSIKKYVFMLISLTIACFVYFVLLRSVSQLWFILIIISIHCMIFIGIRIYYFHNSISIRFICLIFLIFGSMPIGMICAILMIRIGHFDDDSNNAFEHAMDYDMAYIYYWLFHLFGIVFTKIVFFEFVKEGKSKKMSDWLNWFKIVSNHCAILFIFNAVSIKTEKYERAYTFVNIFEERDVYQRGMFVVACLIFIYSICMTAKYSMNQQFCSVNNRKKVFKIYKSSLIVYCCHGFFVELLAFWWFDGIKHYEKELYRTDIWIIYTFAIVLSYSLAFCILRIEKIALFFGLKA